MRQAGDIKPTKAKDVRAEEECAFFGLSWKESPYDEADDEEGEDELDSTKGPFKYSHSVPHRHDEHYNPQEVFHDGQSDYIRVPRFFRQRSGRPVLFSEPFYSIHTLQPPYYTYRAENGGMTTRSRENFRRYSLDTLSQRRFDLSARFNHEQQTAEQDEITEPVAPFRLPFSRSHSDMPATSRSSLTRQQPIGIAKKSIKKSNSHKQKTSSSTQGQS